MNAVLRAAAPSLPLVWRAVLCCSLVAAAPLLLAAAESDKAQTEHTAWLAKTLREIQKIKPGMTRADLLKVFQEEGGLSNRTQRRYVYRGSPFIKVDVRFEAIGAPEDKLTESPQDKITKISKPFLEGPIIDAISDSDAPSDGRRRLAEIVRFITIPSSDLPKGVRLVQPIRTAPLIPLTRNPDLLVAPEQIKAIATFFGMQDRSDRETVRAAAAAIYQENDPANEIGVYGLYFRDEKLAERWFEKLTKSAADPPFLLKGALLLYVWKDEGVSESAFKAIRDHLKVREIR